MPQSERLERIRSIGDDENLTATRAQQRETRDVERSQEATFTRWHRSEVALAISSQPKSVARVRPRRIRLSVVEVSSHNQIAMPVTIDIVGDDRPEG
jgi:hypothetical protein